MIRKKDTLKTFSELYERIARTGLVVPQAVTTEESVLGAIMTNKTAAGDALRTIGAVDYESSPFYREAHTSIYRAMVNLDAAGEPIDQLSVISRLRLDGELENVGGPSYIVELVGKVVTTANVEAHCRILLEEHARRLMMRKCEEIKMRCSLGEDDPFELATEMQLAGSAIDDIRNIKRVLSMREVNRESIVYYSHLKSHSDKLTGVGSGLTDLDEITGGWQNTDLIIVAARPSQGKTALSLTLARNAAMSAVGSLRVPTAIFSLEMGAQQLALRMHASESGQNLQEVRRGRLTQEGWTMLGAGVARMDDIPLFIDDTAGITPMELRAKCRRLKQQHNLGLVIVDYLQLMELSRAMDSREREISIISRSLKSLAKELNIPVIALSQLNRGVESRPDKRPMLSDLRESGAIEQDADLVLFIYRPSTYGFEQWQFDGKPTEGTAEIIIGKHRNGPIGSVRVQFKPERGRFDNLTYMPSFDEPRSPVGETF